MVEAAALEEVQVQTKEPTLRIWDFTQVDELAIFAKLVGETPELWDDLALRNPTGTFQQLYCNPTNLVFEIGERAGMLAVTSVIPGFRGYVMVAAWKPEAMRVPELWRMAIRAAMVSRDLRYVEGLIADDNEMSRNAAESTGFENRGRLLRPSHYNGQPKDMLWYVLTREAVGLEE